MYIFQYLRAFTTTTAHKHRSILFTYWFPRKHYCLAIIYMNAELLNGIWTEVFFVMTLTEIYNLQYMNTEMKML